MEENKNASLNGFDIFLESDFKGMGNEPAAGDITYSEPLDDEEFAKITGRKPANDDHQGDDDNDNDVPDELKFLEPEEEKRKPGRPKKNQEPEDEPEDEEEEPKPTNKKKPEDQPAASSNEDGNDSDFDQDMISGLFASINEQLGWSYNDDEVPATPEDLVKFFSEEIKELAKPTYHSKEIEELDNFVKNGGNLKDYFSIDADLDLESMDMEDENSQKVVIKEFLKEKGFSNDQIKKKIDKYDQAGLLEDEAQDAIDALKEIHKAKKDQLLENTRIQNENYQKQQQKTFNDVVDYIKGLSDIRGVKVPEKDKKVLAEYIFKPSTDGQTAFQKAYAQNYAKNLVESAYFALKGDLLINSAKQEGNSAAIAKFKDSLSKKGAVTKKSKGDTTRSSDYSIWDTMSARFRQTS